MTWLTPTSRSAQPQTMTVSTSDDRPTRKRPVAESVDDAEEKVIVLIGPHLTARQTLFRRLISGGLIDKERVRTADCGEFTLGGERMQLVVAKNSTSAPAVLGERHLALCVTTDTDPHGTEMWAFWEALRKSRDPACVVLVSASRHLPAMDEAPWKSAIAKRGLTTKVFRVNCADSMSPELFARLLTSPVEDQGEQTDGISVQYVDG